MKLELKLNFWIDGNFQKDPKHLVGYVGQQLVSDIINRKHEMDFDRHEISVALSQTDFEVLTAATDLANKIKTVTEMAEEVSKELTKYGLSLDAYLKRQEISH